MREGVKETFRKEWFLVMRRILFLTTAGLMMLLMAAPLMAAGKGGKTGKNQPAAKEPAADQPAAPADAAPPPPPPAGITDEDVTRAIEKGREWLSSQQTNGQWPEQTYWHSPSAVGHTELATMTLLYTGSNPVNSAVMVAAIDALIARKAGYTYAVCCRTMAYAYALKSMSPTALKRDTIRTALLADAQWLVNAQHDDGGWTYQGKGGQEAGHRIDFSNTQFAILALWEAARVGIEIPDLVWQRALDLYTKNQQQDGSWNYGPNTEHKGEGYGSMTAAGLATLFICADMLDLASGCPCRGGMSTGSSRADVDRKINQALGWLEANFVVNTNPSPSGAMAGWRLYWLYAVERVGIAAGYKYFGTHNWYQEGAAALLKEQAGDGSWAKEAEGSNYASTCFAVLFLYKGRAPILFNKLQETPGGEKWEWTKHRRDIANLTSYIEKTKEQAFQWQIVNLKVPIEELHDAPILYITAESPPKFTDDEIKKLRTFTDTGGTILLEASCGAPAVREWFMKFAKEVWPEWSLKPLGPDHPVFSEPNPLAKQRPEIMGIDDGLRTCVFYAMDDISCPWQTKAIVAKEYLFKWGINLFTYATDKGKLRSKLATREPAKSDRYATAVKAGAKANLTLARLKTDGDWITNRNYKGLDKIAADLAKKAAITLKVEDDGTDATALAGNDIAYMTGSKEVTLAKAQGQALKDYLAKGGFLWAEAAGGSSAFDQSFRKMAADMGLELRVLDRTAPVLTGNFKGATGYKLTAGVQFRRALKMLRPGRAFADLVGLYQDGKLVGVYSPFDIVFSATPYDANGCKGYEVEDAAAVATNIIISASDR